MMNGVEILSENIVLYISQTYYLILIFATAGFLAGLISNILLNITKGKSIKFVSICSIICFVCLFIEIWLGYTKTYTEYIIKLDNTASYLEFTNTYTITEKLGENLYRTKLNE